jgi:hypothetical protein
MYLKVFLKLKNPKKLSLLGKYMYTKILKKPKKNHNKKQQQQKTHWAGFFLTGFFQPWQNITKKCSCRGSILYGIEER